jgi:hypothetical protein
MDTDQGSTNVITKCPARDNDGILDSIPISDKEVYDIDSNQESRIKLESCINYNDDNNDNIVQGRFKMNIISDTRTGRQSSGSMAGEEQDSK